jgi:hypothetical protein
MLVKERKKDMEEKTEDKDKLTKAEERDLKVLSKQSHVPVEEIKAQPAAPEKTQQEEFNEKLKDLSKTVLDLVRSSGGGDIKSEQITRVVHDTLKFAHLTRYSPGAEFNPIEPVVSV